MPELPEVEAARRILEEHCVGREITLVDAAEDESMCAAIVFEKFSMWDVQKWF